MPLIKHKGVDMDDKNLNNVDQIRDLIFGSQIKDFEDKFAQLNSMLETAEKKIDKSIYDTNLKLQIQTERSIEALEKKIDNISTLAHRERVKLKELISATDESLQEQFANQKDEFATKIRIIKNSVEDDNRKMQENLQVIKNDIENSLKSGLSTLNEDKLSRDIMSQFLIDMAIKVQGTNEEFTLIKDEKTK